MKNIALFLLLAIVTAGAAVAQDEAAAPEPAKNPQVTLETSKGTIVLELFADKAPKTVENFLGYVESGFYSDTIFHRVIPGFMVQGGGFTADMTKKGTRDPIANEADNGLGNDRGTIAMARTGDPHSATAQFFINTVDNTFLNHKGKTAQGWGYTVFGKVVEGLEAVDAISAVGSQSGKTKETVTINKATVKK